LLEERLRGLFVGRRFKLAYIPSRSDRERKFFAVTKEYLSKLGIQEFLYFDIDEEYKDSLIEDFQKCDGIYLSGGNTFYFLKNLQERNLLNVIKGMVNNGKLLMGVSAGSILMSKTIKIAEYIDENIVNLESLVALNLVENEFMPHWETNQGVLKELLKYSNEVENSIYTCYDGDGIVIQGDHVEFFGHFNEINRGKIFTPKGIKK
jgi:dipeptidase E